MTLRRLLLSMPAASSSSPRLIAASKKRAWAPSCVKISCQCTRRAVASRLLMMESLLCISCLVPISPCCWGHPSDETLLTHAKGHCSHHHLQQDSRHIRPIHSEHAGFCGPGQMAETMCSVLLVMIGGGRRRGGGMRGTVAGATFKVPVCSRGRGQHARRCKRDVLWPPGRLPVCHSPSDARQAVHKSRLQPLRRVGAGHSAPQLCDPTDTCVEQNYPAKGPVCAASP